jgi:hypothetical protein
MKRPGGYGFWQDDLTEIDRLNGELAEAKEALTQETELIRLRSELKEKQTKIEQHTLVYDTIARRTQTQSQAITRLAEEGRTSPEPAIKKQCRDRIALFGAYIKRYANLTLLSQESDAVEAGELALSVSEVLRYLNFCGIPGEFVGSADGIIASGAALCAFETFETILEASHPSLRGVFVNLSETESILLKMTFENMTVPIPGDVIGRLEMADIPTEVQQEDDVTYVCLTLPKGGKTA